MQKQKLRNNRIKRTNTKNMPMFILIGLIAMIIIIAVIYYVFLRYSPEQIITYSGYAIEGKTMAENLKSEETGEIEQYLNLIEVKENDLLYKRLNSYYIGEDDKKEVDINYPMYINEGNTIFNISRNTKLITVNYEEVEGYPEFMLTGGVMYNGSDLTRADGNKYIFLKSEDEIYTNVQAIKIKTATNEYEIKEYSNIYFTENAITYYEMQDGYMQYKRISDIDNNSEIEVNGETLTYKTFLERLGIVQSEENINNSNEEENTINENTIENEEVEQENNNQNNVINDETNENEWQEGMWAKPEVSCTDFESDVYTIRTNLRVTDRAGVITRGVIFEISLDGRLNRRVQATKTGELEITGLQPNTEYEIVGIVYYNDENGIEVEEEFYTGSVTTKSIDTLGTIDFSFENGEIYSNKIELIHLKINNDVNEEVIKGISRIQIEIRDVAYRLSNDEVNQIKAGEEITYQTSETIDSNSKIRYEITAFDKFGNELKEINNTGETITSKQSPSASIRATKQDVTEVNLEVTLTNKDNVTLENYRYEIINQSGDKVKEGQLTNDTETLVFIDLDPNGYYQIIIYGDYDLDNGEGKQENQELGRGSFVTRPLASLGYMQVKIDDKEVTQNEMKLGISIDENQTDARLIAILDKVEVVIYDKGKNVDNNVDNDTEEQSTETEIQRITLTNEEVEQLKIAEEVEINIDQLTSNTKYRIDVITTVKQGSVEEVIEDKQNLSEIITLKMPAEVQIRNQFVIGDMIDLDIRVEDIDNAVLTNNVRIEVRDEENKLVNLSEMNTNSDYERKVYENLEPETTYRIIIYAPQYNEGSTDETYHADYILKEIEIYTEAGISGTLDLVGLEKTGIGKNLIDVSSKVNWYEQCFNIGVYYGLSYDEETKIITLGNELTHRAYTYYDLSKYIGQEVTISFKARNINASQIAIIEKNEDNPQSTGFTTYHTITNLASEWKEYTYTVILEKSGYIGFYKPNYQSIELKDLQIELGSIKTNYEEFKYILNANMNINVIDERDEIATNDYYIRIYKNGEQLQEIRYEEIGEENIVANIKKTYEVEENANYTIELLVKIQDRYYELDSQEFSTERGTEIKGISNLKDYLKIQPYGTYIVLNDLDLTNATSTNEYRFGIAQFEGRIDFNGKTVTKDASTTAGMFYIIGSNGIVENLVLDIKMNNEVALTEYKGISSTNYGTIRNVQMNIIETTEKENSFSMLMCYVNEGRIENFIVNFKEPYYISGIDSNGSTLIANNYGIIRNGYIYGENVKMIGGTHNIAGVLVRNNSQNSIVENIYSLVSVDLIGDTSVAKHSGNIVYNNVYNATMQNVYSVGIGENTTIYSNGPNVYTDSSQKVYNSYYFTDEIFNNEYNIKGNKLSLWDVEFQNQIINTSGAFEVDSLVNQGYYPQLIMPEVMPRQEYIELPEVENADLPDILSTKVLEQKASTVKVEFSVNNPSSENIENIQIENITVNILSQEYKDGKSIVVAELKDPIICVSSYDVLSITTRGAFNSSYTREFEEGERTIYVDLYKEIWNVNDWINIANSNRENYVLMADLDFINEENRIRLPYIYGIIDGNNHTISNINLTNSGGLINNLYGELKNINFKNVNLIDQTTGSYNGGIIYYGRLGSIIDNVHVVDMTVTREVKNTSCYVGGIVGYAISNTVKNSSIANLEIKDEIEEQIETQYIGGIVGYGNNSTIQNCYVKNLDINITNAISNYTGGIIGFENSYGNIRNCYAQGKIIAEGNNIGGIIGTAGYATIENNYSIVYISSEGSNIGGIIGNIIRSDTINILNNVSIGNIYTAQGIESLGRVAGNNQEIENINYAYENQMLNGYARKELLGAIILSKEEILNLNLGEAYNYEGKEKGILPKLYNTEGTELLPNQTDIYLDSNTEAELTIESIEANKPNATEAEISIMINNPEEVEITGIEIEDMNITIIRNVTQNKITNILVRAAPNRYYDSYKLTQIRYKLNSSAQDNITTEQIKEVEIGIEVQFYKEIYSYEDWQSIEEGTYQNYRLMADIDFSGRENIKNNITVNRLEADNNVYTLKNINLEYNEANTGLIKNVRTSIKNIGFENITIENTNSSGNYCGVIATNNGNIDNLILKNIIIEANNMSYVGVIGWVNSGSVKNITLDTINITGISYIGGLSGRCDYEVNNITANNINITASGNYVGGIIGYEYNAAFPEQSNIDVTNSNIIGIDYVGGITGYDYSIILTNNSVINSVITGANYVGGMTGSKTCARNVFYNIVDNCEIYGSGENIGGLSGYSGSYEYNAEVKNSKIEGTTVDSENIGGMFGTQVSRTAYNVVDNCEIISKGDVVGGVSGYIYGNSLHSPRYCYVDSTKIEGRSKVGGIVGVIHDGPIYGCLVNARIIATDHTAGGITGYMDNENMTAAVNMISMYNNEVTDSTISSPSKVGGLVGDIAKDLNTEASFFYNNYVHAYLTCDDENVSMGVGGLKENNDAITNTHIYKYSQINDEYMNEDIDTYTEEQYVYGEELREENTYRNEFGWGTYFTYTSLQEEKYPIPNGVENVEGIDLPTDPEIVELNSLENEVDTENVNNAGLVNENGISIQSIEILPEVTVYQISVNEINIDFSSISEDISLTYYINASEMKTVDLTEKTCTFEYNFVDIIEIVISNGTDKKTITINPSEIRSEISLVGDNYTYLKGNNLYINGTLQEGEYVNIYEGYALNTSGQVLDVSSEQVVENKTIETKLQETAKPLHTYEYKESRIEVYGTYSKIDGNVKSQIYNVRSGILSALSDSLDMKTDNYIVDNYNDKEYQTILTSSGEVVDLKDQLQYPTNFLSRNIKQIAQNSNIEETEMMVIYNTGKVIVFNYVSGDIIYETEENADEGLTNYITGSINSIWSDYENKQEEYLRSKELIAKLTEMPIEEILNEINSNERTNNQNNFVNNISNANTSVGINTESYITVYNKETGEYEVYSESEILEGEEENPVSETEKIKANGLESVYKYEQKEETGTKVNGAILVILIIITLMISLIILRKLIYRSTKKNKDID